MWGVGDILFFFVKRTTYRYIIFLIFWFVSLTLRLIKRDNVSLQAVPGLPWFHQYAIYVCRCPILTSIQIIHYHVHLPFQQERNISNSERNTTDWPRLWILNDIQWECSSNELVQIALKIYFHLHMWCIQFVLQRKQQKLSILQTIKKCIICVISGKSSLWNPRMTIIHQ